MHRKAQIFWWGDDVADFSFLGGGGGEMVYKHYFQFLDSVDSASKKEPSSKYSNKFKF